MLLFAHRNSGLALGMNAAFDCLCAVSNIGVQLFRRPPFPTLAVPAAVGIVVALAVHVAVHVQRERGREQQRRGLRREGVDMARLDVVAVLYRPGLT
jgi:hypothetical protein